MLGNPLTGAVDAATKAEYVPFQNKVVRALDRTVPGYRDSLAAYRAGKQPINDMQAGRSLLDAIDSGGRDTSGNQNVDLTKVRSLLQSNAKARYGMSPDAKGLLSNVMETLQQRTVAGNKVSATGSNTTADAASLKTMYDRLANWGGTIGRGTGYAAGLLTGMPGVGDIMAGEVGNMAGLLAKHHAAKTNALIMEQVGQHLSSA